MSIRRILTIDNAADLAVLKQVSKPVAAVDDAVRTLMDDMLETMYAAPGVGLAATQVDRHLRLVVVDVSETRDQPHVLINPEILSRDGKAVGDEGCLSVPGVTEGVERAERIRVRALDAKGQAVEFDAEGLLAVCIQHELDHLVGKLFVDYLSELKRQRLRKKAGKARKRDAAGPPPSRDRAPVI